MRFSSLLAAGRRSAGDGRDQHPARPRRPAVRPSPASPRRSPTSPDMPSADGKTAERFEIVYLSGWAALDQTARCEQRPISGTSAGGIASSRHLRPAAPIAARSHRAAAASRATPGRDRGAGSCAARRPARWRSRRALSAAGSTSIPSSSRNLADQSGLGQLARLDLAAGKLPQPRHRPARRALLEQNAARAVDQGRGHHRHCRNFLQMCRLSVGFH